MKGEHTKAWNICLPMPTRANNLVRPAILGGKNTKPRARLVKTADGKAWKATARALLKQRAMGMGFEMLEGPVRVILTLQFRSVRSDIDGPLKALFDACSGIVWLDDRQITDLRVTKWIYSGSAPESCALVVEHDVMVPNHIASSLKKPSTRGPTPNFKSHRPKEKS